MPCTICNVTTVNQERQVDGGLWTVPNLISIGRLACIPIFLYLLFGRDNRVGAGLLLAALGATDWVDGWIARRFNQVSNIGKVLDPTADRLLFIVGIVGIILDGSAPRWLCVLVVVREAAIGSAMVILTTLGMKRFDVTYLGKCATFALMFAFPMFLAHAGFHTGRTAWLVAAWLFAAPGLALSYYTAIAYVPQMRTKLREGRAERSVQPEGETR